jgi:hypothetical protein
MPAQAGSHGRVSESKNCGWHASQPAGFFPLRDGSLAVAGVEVSSLVGMAVAELGALDGSRVNSARTSRCTS